MSTNPNSGDLNDLKKKVGLDDLGEIQVEQFAQIQEMAAEGEVSLDQIKQLVSALPQFVELQKQTIDGLKQIVEGAKESQQAAVQSVSQSLNTASRTLEILAEKAETDETRLKLAELAVEVGRQSIEISNIIAGMNRDNNDAWVKFATIGGGFAAAALVFVLSGGRIKIPTPRA